MRSAGRIKAQKNKDNVWKSWMLFLGKGLRRFVQYNEISFPSETTENQWEPNVNILRCTSQVSSFGARDSYGPCRVG